MKVIIWSDVLLSCGGKEMGAVREKNEQQWRAAIVFGATEQKLRYQLGRDRLKHTVLFPTYSMNIYVRNRYTSHKNNGGAKWSRA